MKNFTVLLGAGLVSLLAGCSSTPVALAPVGPNPAVGGSQGAEGGLQVYSGLVGRSEGNNPAWYQHSGYYLYDAGGKRVQRVDNITGYYEQAPRQMVLPAGKYLVKAQAKDYFWVEVPVTIESGHTTRIHLDDNWKLPADVSKKELVSLPNGRPVGWLAESAPVDGQ
jgi:hypothetical protein